MKCRFKGCTNEGVACVLRNIDNKDLQLCACEKREGDSTHWSLLALTFEEDKLKEMFDI